MGEESRRFAVIVSAPESVRPFLPSADEWV